MSDLCIIVPAVEAQIIKKALTDLGVWDGDRRLVSMPSTKSVAIPIKSKQQDKTKVATFLKENLILSKETENVLQIIEMKLPLAKKRLIVPPQRVLTEAVKDLLESRDMTLTDQLKTEIPDSWEKHGDLILLHGHHFCSDHWKEFGCELWQKVCESLQCRRLARKTVISQNGFRSPQVTMLYGKEAWVEHVDNGIRYNYDITKCMFSSGNITEKLRVSKFNCDGETVVDLYAGIGYFTLPYLVYTGVKHLHACEWNPDAVEALKRNLKLNGVEDRCSIHFGDNRKVCPRNVADRVNLGLIPSSEQGWKTGCAALKSDTGGVLHIHANVNSMEEPRSECSYVDGATQFKSDNAIDTYIERELAEPTVNITNGQDSRLEYSSTDRGSQFHNVNDVDTELSGDLAETTADITHVNVNSIEKSRSECSYVDGTAQFQSDNVVDTDICQYLPHRHCAEPTANTTNGQDLRSEYSSTERAAQFNSNNAVDTDVGRDLGEPTANIHNGENSCAKFPDFIKEHQPATASFGLNSQNSSNSGFAMPNNSQNSTVEDNAEQTVSKFDNIKQSDTSSDIVLELNKYNYSHLEDNLNTDHIEAEKDDLNTDHIEAEKNDLNTDHIEAEKDDSNTDHIEAEKDDSNTDHIEAEKDNLDTDHVEAEKDNLDTDHVEAEKGNLNTDHVEAEKDNLDTDHVEAEKDDLNTDHIEAEKDKYSAISARNLERYSKWLHWCEKVSHVIQQLLSEVHGGVWQTKILHVEHVKSYAPHVDHIVLDLKCLPVIEDNLSDIEL